MAGFHEISTYQVLRYPTMVTSNIWGFTFSHLGYIVCRTTAGYDDMYLYVVPDGDVPEKASRPKTISGTTYHSGFMGIPRDEMPFYVDLLRNEKPVFMYIHGSNAGTWNRIQTGSEPVGEGEEP